MYSVAEIGDMTEAVDVILDNVGRYGDDTARRNVSFARELGLDISFMNGDAADADGDFVTKGMYDPQSRRLVIDAAFALEAASDPDAGMELQGVIAHEMQHVWHWLSGDPTLPALIPADDPRFAPEGRGDFADKREAYLAAVFEPEIVGEVHAHHQQILNGPEPEPGSELARLSDIIGEFAAGEIPPDRMEAAKALIADDPDFGYRETIRDDFGAMFDREYGLAGSGLGVESPANGEMLLRQIDALTPAEFINGLLPPEVRRVDPRAWATLPGKARTFEALGIQTVEPRQDAGGLLIGGVNSSETIRGLETINGLSVNTLEDLMRPGRGDPRQSVSGYLGDRDELLQIMAKDNDAVSANGMTHQQIAASMSYFIEMSNRNPHHVGSAGDPPVILLNGLAFEVEYRQWGDFQQSPFNDGSRSIRDYFVTRIDTGDTITVSPLLRDMVERYGFYEGDTRYRVDPDTWIRFLGLGGNQVTGLDAP